MYRHSAFCLFSVEENGDGEILRKSDFFDNYHRVLLVYFIFDVDIKTGYGKNHNDLKNEVLAVNHFVTV
ncbi:hypothetical protein GCK32_012808 [Trichostrongylus colubriformis]|uniref:Uncharacterized protein n=1 Tax=Trichostrongylus colubriformis TaxID=6319 RepID=A0AAN8FKT5_TRICO